MRIIHINFSLCQGGAERFIVDLSNELSKNHEVYLITIRDEKIPGYSFFKNEVNQKVKYINFPIEEGFKLSDYIKLNRFVNSLNPDIIHTHLQTVYFFLLTAIFNKKVRVFHTIHNDAFFDGQQKLPTFIRKYFYKFNIIKPVTISNESHFSYEKFYNLKNANLIFNGTRVPEKSEKFKNVQMEIEQLKPNKNGKVFIHVSRFSEHQKKHSILIQAFNKLSKEYPNNILIIIGRGFEDKSAKWLHEISSDKVFFLHEKPNIADYLLISDAFCLSSQDEGLPISLLEAIACGVIPICTPVGGIKDIIQNRITGYLSNEVSIASYFEVLKEFIENPNLIDKEYLKKYFNQNYSIEKAALNHEKLYQKFLKLK